MKTYKDEDKLIAAIDKALDKSNTALFHYHEKMEASKIAIRGGDKAQGEYILEQALKLKKASDRQMARAKRLGKALAKFQTQTFPGMDVPQEVRA